MLPKNASLDVKLARKTVNVAAEKSSNSIALKINANIRNARSNTNVP